MGGTYDQASNLTRVEFTYFAGQAVNSQNFRILTMLLIVGAIMHEQSGPQWGNNVSKKGQKC